MSDEDQYFQTWFSESYYWYDCRTILCKTQRFIGYEFLRESSKLLFDFTLDGSKSYQSIADITVTAKNVGTAGNAITIEITDVAAAQLR